MRPIDQAVGFATFAAGGVHRNSYFVAKVTDSAGYQLLGPPADQGEQVVPADVANDVSVAIKGVAAYSTRPLEGGREVAAKTGTQGLDRTNNSDAWMVGYTPSISTAVWMGTDKRLPIKNASGQIIYGSGLPGAIWQKFMDTVLKGTPKEKLPDKALIQGDTGEGVPEPTTSAPTQSSAPTTQASQTPTETQATTTTPTSPPASSSAPTSSAPGVPSLPTGQGNGQGNGQRQSSATTTR